MADILCGYTADRDETLVAYLYDDIDEGQRAAFDAHLATCERCRRELSELQRVRGTLQQWMPPDSGILSTSRAPLAVVSPNAGAPQRSWRDVPAWAQVAAALLFVGVSAGVANLDVRYDANGFTIRTGWSRPVSSESRPTGLTGSTTASAPWRADLDALERRLRTEARAASAPTAAVRDEGAADAQLLRRVRTLVEDSERRQRNELALQIGEVVKEFDAKRGSDLANLRTLRNEQAATGIAVVQTQQYVDLLRRASISMQR